MGLTPPSNEAAEPCEPPNGYPRNAPCLVSFLTRQESDRGHLYHCPFEIGLCSGKGGHGRLGRVETGLLSRTLPIRPQHTGETRCAPLLKSKSKRLLVLRVFADVLFDQGFLRGYFFPMSTQQLTSEAMALPISERVSLAQALWQSIDAGLAAAKDREAIAEAIRRDEELSSGEVQGRTHEEVMRAARRAIGCA